MGSLYRPGSIWWVKYYRNGRPLRESTGTSKETEARRFLKELLKTAPGGFVDALFGELAQYKASVFRVPHKDPS